MIEYIKQNDITMCTKLNRPDQTKDYEIKQITFNVRFTYIYRETRERKEKHGMFGGVKEDFCPF